MHSTYIAPSSYLKYPDSLSDNVRQQAPDIRRPTFCLDNRERSRNEVSCSSLLDVKAYNSIIPALEILGALADGENVSLWFWAGLMLR